MKKTSDNRPNCCELLQKINEFSVDKSLLTEDNILEKFKIVVKNQLNCFLQKFLNIKSIIKIMIEIPNPFLSNLVFILKIEFIFVVKSLIKIQRH